MRYFVIADDGQQYGPADVATLSQWVADGRVTSTSRLMDEMTGNLVVASSLPGLHFPPPSGPPAPSYRPMSPPPPETCQPIQPYQPIPPGPYQYTKPGSDFMPKYGGGNPTNDILISFAMVLLSPILSLFCIYGFTTALFGIAAGWRAFQNGSKLALVPVVLNGLGLVFWALSRFVFRYWLFNRF